MEAAAARHQHYTTRSMASGGKKRTLLEAVATDEPTLWVQLADATRLPAHRDLLRISSTCVRGLPPSDTWDISGVLIEGQPVSRTVAVAWLTACYDGANYADEGSLQPEDDRPPPAAELLLFADAVGSSSRVISACYERCKQQLSTLSVSVEGERLALHIDRCYMLNEDRKTFEETNLITITSLKQLQGHLGEVRQDLSRQLACVIEPVLHMAYRLDIGELQERLHGFLQSHTGGDDTCLIESDVLKSVAFSERVMQAVDKQRLKDAWVCYALMGPQLFGGARPLFKRLPEGGDEPEFNIRALLKRPFMGAAPGTEVQLGFTPSATEAVLNTSGEGWTMPVTLRAGDPMTGSK